MSKGALDYKVFSVTLIIEPVQAWVIYTNVKHIET